MNPVARVCSNGCRHHMEALAVAGVNASGRNQCSLCAEEANHCPSCRVQGSKAQRFTPLTWKVCRSGISSSGSHPSLLMVSLSAGSPGHSLTLPKRRASQYAKSQVAPTASPGRGLKCRSSLWKRGGQLVLSCGALHGAGASAQGQGAWHAQHSTQHSIQAN
jgi:hypothetical protein